MKDNIEIYWLVIPVIICFTIPIVGIILLSKKTKKLLVPFFMGTAAFTLSQIIIRIPLLQILNFWPPFKQFASLPILYALFLSLTAGLFEEFARFFAFGLIKKNRRFEDGLAFGLGHGGIEAILLVGVSYVVLIFVAIAVNSGAGQNIPQELIAPLELVTQGAVLMAGMERASAIVIHMALSVFVLYGYCINKKWIYLTIAILAHTAVNAVAAIMLIYLGQQNALAVEGVLVIMAAALMVWAFKLKKGFESPPV